MKRHGKNKLKNLLVKTKNLDLYQKAFTHKSALKEYETQKI